MLANELGNAKKLQGCWIIKIAYGGICLCVSSEAYIIFSNCVLGFFSKRFIVICLLKYVVFVAVPFSGEGDKKIKPRLKGKSSVLQIKIPE